MPDILSTIYSSVTLESKTIQRPNYLQSFDDNTNPVNLYMIQEVEVSMASKMAYCNDMPNRMSLK